MRALRQKICNQLVAPGFLIGIPCGAMLAVVLYSLPLAQNALGEAIDAFDITFPVHKTVISPQMDN